MQFPGFQVSLFPSLFPSPPGPARLVCLGAGGFGCSDLSSLTPQTEGDWRANLPAASSSRGRSVSPVALGALTDCQAAGEVPAAFVGSITKSRRKESVLGQAPRVVLEPARGCQHLMMDRPQQLMELAALLFGYPGPPLLFFFFF